MIRQFWNCLLVAAVISAGACKSARNESSGVVAEAHDSGPDSVGFDIHPVQSGNGSQAWLASCVSKGKTARFRIELEPAHVSAAKDSKDFSFRFGKGRFVAEQGSDAEVLVMDLKKALAAKALPSKVERSATLPFTFVNLGENMSHDSGRGFSEKPRGSWTAMKIFLEAGDQEGEVFLNLNPQQGRGEFSIKDEDYGDFVVAQLAKVL
jgi:hypothetical protein